MKDALARARSLYQRQNVRLALEILESNISQVHKLTKADQIQALDLLAALHEKQGSLAKAQSYAVQTVKVDPTDLRGYLRLGKILQLTPEKVDQAIRVYERALKKAQFKNKDQRAFIDRQLMLCNLRIQAGNGIKSAEMERKDPLHYLPVEIMSHIFLDFNTRELITACQVCKIWRQFIESQPQLWSCIRISPPALPNAASRTISGKQQQPQQIVSITPATIVKYINLSHHRLELDLQQAAIRTPESLFQALGRGNVNDRLESLCFDNTGGSKSTPATVKMLRELKIPFNSLRELRITTGSPSKDLKWCVTELPALETLDLVTTASQLPPTRPMLGIKVRSTNLHTLSILGQSGTACIHDFTLAEIIGQLPKLTSVGIYRVNQHYWPTLCSLFANPELQKFGFSGDTGNAESRMVMALPNFVSPQLQSLTLNSARVSTTTPALTMPFAERWDGAGPGLQDKLEYLELKRVELMDSTFCELINEWGCSKSLQTLVIHSLTQRQPSTNTSSWIDLELSSLHTLQYTNMNSISNAAVNWILKNCQALRKLNLEGTSVTGPQLVTLLKCIPSLVAVRCPTLIEASADTIQWLSSLPGRNIIFGAS